MLHVIRSGLHYFDPHFTLVHNLTVIISPLFIPTNSEKSASWGIYYLGAVHKELFRICAFARRADYQFTTPHGSPFTFEGFVLAAIP
jgi:hypothetical protein